MFEPKLTDIYKVSAKDSACVEDTHATGTAKNFSHEEMFAGEAGAPGQRPELVVVPERRRRFSAQEKVEYVKLTYAPDQSVSSVARQYNISPSLLFKWRQLYKNGGLVAITSGSESAAAKEVAQLKDEIKWLHQLVGRQAADLEAMEVMREKNGLRANPSATRHTQASHLPSFRFSALPFIRTCETR